MPTIGASARFLYAFSGVRYMSTNRCVLFLAITLGLFTFVADAHADIVLVNEDFESYTDNSQLYAVWGPASSDGMLVDENYVEPLLPGDPAVGIRAFPLPNGGQGVEHSGGSILEYQPTLNGGVPLLPTATQSIVLQGDIFDTGNLGNKRMSIGLRSNDPPANLVEIGHFNTSPVELSGRAILFAEPPTAQQPNFQYYELPLSADTDGSGTTTISDLGEAWHTHRLTITPTDITFEVDLFRDGTFDSSMNFDIVPTMDGFTSLRFGAPSGITSPGVGGYGGVIFDNISLTLVNVVPEPSSLGLFIAALTLLSGYTHRRSVR